MNTSYINAWALALTLLATSFTAIYSVRIFYLVSAGFPRFATLRPPADPSPAAINPIKRLAWGSIIAGFPITSNMLPLKTPVMTMHPTLKLSALAVTLAGLLIALELASLTNKQFKPTPLAGPHHFSNMLGFFPAIIHRYTPKINLLLGQTMANQTVDQAWLEKTGPKMLAAVNMPIITSTSNAQQGMIKTYLTIFLFTLALMALLFNT